MKKNSTLNMKAREFKPKNKEVSSTIEPASQFVPQQESKYFKGVLPGQVSRPPPSLLPPGMIVGFEGLKPQFSEDMPEGLRKMFMRAYDDGKFDDLLMKQMELSWKEEQIGKESDLTEEEEAFAAQFFAEQQEVDICPFYMEGTCKYGKKWMYFHPSDVDEIASSVKFSGDRECGICMENTLAKDRQFGLLDGCEHAFCLEWIRNWRATYIKKMTKDAMRMCPLCRKLSYLVIPSNVYLPGSAAKEQLVEEYKETLFEIPCRHFNFGDGECPFLNSCFYAHYTKDGKKFDYAVKARYINEDGDIVTEKDTDQTTLASLIGL